MCAPVLIDVLVAVFPITSLDVCCLFSVAFLFCLERQVLLCCFSPCCHDTKEVKTSMDPTFSDEASLVNTSAAWMFMGTVFENATRSTADMLETYLWTT